MAADARWWTGSSATALACKQADASSLGAPRMAAYAYDAALSSRMTRAGCSQASVPAAAARGPTGTSQRLQVSQLPVRARSRRIRATHIIPDVSPFRCARRFRCFDRRMPRPTGAAYSSDVREQVQTGMQVRVRARSTRRFTAGNRKGVRGEGSRPVGSVGTHGNVCNTCWKSVTNCNLARGTVTDADKRRIQTEIFMRGAIQ